MKGQVGFFAAGFLVCFAIFVAPSLLLKRENANTKLEAETCPPVLECPDPVPCPSCDEPDVVDLSIPSAKFVGRGQVIDTQFTKEDVLKRMFLEDVKFDQGGSQIHGSDKVFFFVSRLFRRD